MGRLSRFTTVIGVLFVLGHCSAAQSSSRASHSAGQLLPIQVANEIVLSGKDWKQGSFEMGDGQRKGAFLPSFDDRSFRTVDVPGEVQLQIGLNGMGLYYQSKALSLINKKEWWYRKRFTVDQGQQGRLLRLMFDGVDYFATVWLNGEQLGEHEGSYVSFSYDVSRKLRFGVVNVLAVRVTCPWIPKGRGFLEYMKGDWTTIDPGNQLHINGHHFFSVRIGMAFQPMAMQLFPWDCGET